MNRRIKRKYTQARKEFKCDLYEKANQNHALAMMIISTYTASQHRTHIGKIWAMFRHHREFAAEYNKKLFGSMLTGSDEIMKALYFSDKELYEKYVRRIPEAFAMGDALAVAYKVLKQRND